MGYWDLERDSDKTCFDHLNKHVPQSIREEAKEELRHRGYSDKYISEKEWEKVEVGNKFLHQNILLFGYSGE